MRLKKCKCSGTGTTPETAVGIAKRIMLCKTRLRSYLNASAFVRLNATCIGTSKGTVIAIARSILTGIGKSTLCGFFMESCSALHAVEEQLTDRGAARVAKQAQLRLNAACIMAERCEAPRNKSFVEVIRLLRTGKLDPNGLTTTASWKNGYFDTREASSLNSVLQLFFAFLRHIVEHDLTAFVRGWLWWLPRAHRDKPGQVPHGHGRAKKRAWKWDIRRHGGCHGVVSDFRGAAVFGRHLGALCGAEIGCGPYAPPLRRA